MFRSLRSVTVIENTYQAANNHHFIGNFTSKPAVNTWSRLWFGDKCSHMPYETQAQMKANNLSGIKSFTFLEGHTGVFLWCVISWFYFLWNMNLGNHSSWHDLNVLCDPWRTWVINICDFTTLFFVIFRHKSSKWLESSIESDSGMRFAIRCLDVTIRDFTFTVSSAILNRPLKKYLTCLFPWFGKTEFYIHDPLLLPSGSSAREPPCTTLF